MPNWEHYQVAQSQSCLLWDMKDLCEHFKLLSSYTFLTSALGNVTCPVHICNISATIAMVCERYTKFLESLILKVFLDNLLKWD